MQAAHATPYCLGELGEVPALTNTDPASCLSKKENEDYYYWTEPTVHQEPVFCRGARTAVVACVFSALEHEAAFAAAAPGTLLHSGKLERSESLRTVSIGSQSAEGLYGSPKNSEP